MEGTVFDLDDFTTELQQALEKAEERLAEKKVTGFKYAHGAEPGTRSFAKLVDHTILKPETTEESLLKVCDEARRWNFKTVCVQPHHVSLAAKHLSDTDVAVCTVISFPAGTRSTQEKVSEAQYALKAGAVELDFVINYPQLLSESYGLVHKELSTIASSVSQAGTPPQERPTIKLILETSQLKRLDVVAGCLLASKAGFDFIKTSTGFLGHGARVEDVRLMRELCEMEGGRMKVKASGGIRTAQDAKAMLDAGAERLGLSGSVAIMEEGMDAKSRNAGTSGSDGY